MVSSKTSLQQIFKSLDNRDQYKKWVKARVVKITLGSSIIRAFGAGTKPDLQEGMIKLDIDDLPNLKTQKEYDEWHAKKIKKIASFLAKIDRNILDHSLEGLQWGHATKIWNIYIDLLVFYSPYFEPSQSLEKIKFLLHIPLDKKVFNALRSSGIKGIPNSIKSVTKEKYYELQEITRKAADEFSLPALYFDEYAWSPS